MTDKYLGFAIVTGSALFTIPATLLAWCLVGPPSRVAFGVWSGLCCMLIGIGVGGAVLLLAGRLWFDRIAS